MRPIDLLENTFKEKALVSSTEKARELQSSGPSPKDPSFTFPQNPKLPPFS